MPERRRARRLTLLALATTATIAAGCGAGGGSADTEPEVSALPVPLSLAFGRNGRAFVQDQVWTHGASQYAVWVARTGSAVVGRRRLPSGRWSTHDLGRVAGNPLALPTEPDEHNVYVVAVDARGFVHVAGNMHNVPVRWVRSRRPGSITRWTAEGRPRDASVTYPQFVRARGGRLLFFYRSGASGEGDLILRRWDPPRRRWSRATTVIDGRSAGESAYPQRIAVDRGGTLHLMYTWRATPDAATTSDLSYARSPDDGRHWETSSGVALPLPITRRTSELVLDTPASGSGLSNAGGLAIDSAGRPHAAVRLRSRLHHVWYDAGRWRTDQVPAPGPDFTRPAVVAGPRGDVFLLTTTRLRRGRSRAWAVRLAGDGTRHRAHGLRDLAVEGWELTFDAEAAREGRLRMLLPGARPPADGELVDFDLDRLGA